MKLPRLIRRLRVAAVVYNGIPTHQLPPPPRPVTQSVPPPIPPAATRAAIGAYANMYGLALSIGQVRKLARQRTAEAIDILTEIMTDRDEQGSARVAAANGILDRGHGKATQPIEIGGPGAFDQMSDDQLDEFCISEARKLMIEVDSNE